MVSPDADLQEKLRLLGASYLAQLPEKIHQIEAAWNNLQTEWNAELLHTLHRMVHSLTGSGATFGFVNLSQAARALEQNLRGVQGQEAAASATQRTHILEQITELKLTASGAVAMPNSLPRFRKAAQPGYETRTNKLIFVVDDDVNVAQELALYLGCFGYKVRIFNRLDEFRQAIRHSPHAVVLMDIEFPGEPLGGVKAIQEIQQGRNTAIVVMFISAHEHLAARLEAVRAGGIAFFTKPINLVSLIGKLDSIMLTLPHAPPQVLLVDDEPSSLAYHAAILEQANMVVRTVSDPMQVLEVALEFHPDLILMDVHMPQCDGMELAKVIRQMEAFVSTPIVYLSAESDPDKHLTAVSSGGDDFLVKPIDPQHLVSALTTRIQRSRLLRSFMVRDGLTGLLNHTAINDQLNLEVARGRRTNMPLTFAMIDIDHFKKVNDTYGHPVGDRVIQSLARLLKQRLREIDVVGRYGGEEFAVILADTDGSSALKLLDDLRNDFAHLRHSSANGSFSVTFSCGIAEFALFEDSVKMEEAADQALYEAKHAGRNCSVLAQG